VNKMDLGKLSKIELREAWKHEALDFTNWLALEENLSLLSDEIGIDIKLLQTEASVGSFNVDILAEEENTGRKIIIENQLEATDHDHLGKLITYASGHNAEFVLWIVKEVRDEHKQAIDWLNDHTDEEINFFAIKMELWKIGESLPAPKFQVISKPNDWAKTIKKATGQSKLTETKIMQLEFWNQFKEYAQNKQTRLRLRKTNPQHWYDISLGSSEAHLSLTLNTQQGEIGCEVYISNNKDLFISLEKYKDEIESELGVKLDWMGLEGRKASRIKLKIETDPTNTDNWENNFEWLLSQSEKFYEVFGKFIKKSQNNN
jgi:hypothetical protein